MTISEEVFDQLVNLIKKFKQEKDCELEGLIGVLKPSEFNPGVDFQYFKEVYNALDSADTKLWTNIEKKEHFVSYFFKDNIRGRYNVKDSPKFVEKSKITSVDCFCQERKYDLRLNLKRETEKTFVPVSKPHFVRLHERWSFTYKNAFRYDLSKVSSGKTKDLAARNQPSYEIEVEILKGSEFIAQNPVELVATNFLAKLIDLLGRFDGDYEVLPLSLVTKRVWTLPQHPTGMS
jgi:hypothetical protein